MLKRALLDIITTIQLILDILENKLLPQPFRIHVAIRMLRTLMESLKEGVDKFDE